MNIISNRGKICFFVAFCLIFGGLVMYYHRDKNTQAPVVHAQKEQPFYQWLYDHYSAQAIADGVIERTKQNDENMFMSLPIDKIHLSATLFENINQFIQTHGLNLQIAPASIRPYLEDRIQHFDHFIYPLITANHPESQAQLREQFIRLQVEFMRQRLTQLSAFVKMPVPVQLQ